MLTITLDSTSLNYMSNQCPECGSVDRPILKWPCDDGPNSWHDQPAGVRLTTAKLKAGADITVVVAPVIMVTSSGKELPPTPHSPMSVTVYVPLDDGCTVVIYGGDVVVVEP